MDFIDVPRPFLIIDPRPAKSLRSLTLSGFRKIDVKKALEEAVQENNLEVACRWAIELHISGQTEVFWEVVFNISCQTINILNPNLYIWLWSKYLKYKHLNSLVQKKYQYELRNNQEMRNLITEVTSIVALSKKNNLLLHPPPIYDSDFHHQIIQDHCIAEDFQEIKNYTTNEDDSEVVLAMNEILNVLRFNLNTSAIYWYHWLDKLTLLKKKDKTPIHCQMRKVTQIKDTYCSDWVWILWNILLDQGKNVGLEKYIRALCNLYKHNFTTTTRKNKHVIISTAILFLKYHINHQIKWNTPVVRNYSLYLQAVGNINPLYKNIYSKIPKNFDEELVYQKIRAYKFPSEQFKKYLKRFDKEFSEEARQSNYKAKVFNEIVTYKDPDKTYQSINDIHQKDIHKAKHHTTKVDYNVIKKKHDHHHHTHQSPDNSTSILDYYQQPNISKEIFYESPHKSNANSKHTSKEEGITKACLISELDHIPKKKIKVPSFEQVDEDVVIEKEEESNIKEIIV